MNIISRYGSSVAATALLAACGGSQSVAGAPGAMPAASIVQNVDGASTSQSALIYEFDQQARQVAIYSYPAGDLVANFDTTPAMYPEGICSDGKGDVFLTGTAPGNTLEVYEYPFGATTPSAMVTVGTVPDGGATGPCSVDDTTGNVAFIDFGSGHTLAVLPGFKSPAVFYAWKHPYAEPRSVAYDGSGNIFVLGSSNHNTQAYLAKLSRGGKSLKNIAANFGPGGIYEPVAVQWDGKYVTVSATHTVDGKQKSHWIYQFAVSGSGAKLAGIVKFDTFSARPDSPTWIQANRDIMVAGRSFDNQLGDFAAAWSYPAGGKQVDQIPNYVFNDTIGGITVAAPASDSPHRRIP